MYRGGSVTMSGDLDAFRRCFQPRQWFGCDGEPDPFVLKEEDSLMWVYRPIKDNSGLGSDHYEVGFFTPDGQWVGDSTHETREGAAARVNYLNGGKK